MHFRQRYTQDFAEKRMQTSCQAGGRKTNRKMVKMMQRGGKKNPCWPQPPCGHMLSTSSSSTIIFCFSPLVLVMLIFPCPLMEDFRSQGDSETGAVCSFVTQFKKAKKNVSRFKKQLPKGTAAERCHLED